MEHQPNIANAQAGTDMSAFVAQMVTAMTRQAVSSTMASKRFQALNAALGSRAEAADAGVLGTQMMRTP